MVLRLRVPAPDNWQGAKCHIIDVTQDYDPFFPDEQLPTEEKALLENDAVEFCNGTADGEVCQLRDECLIFALTNNERHGVWGGTPRTDRRLIRKIYPKRSGKEPHPSWRWFSPEEIQSLLAASIESGEISEEQVDVEDDEDYDDEEI